MLRLQPIVNVMGSIKFTAMTACILMPSIQRFRYGVTVWVILLLALLIHSPAQAARYYRYLDEQGEVVIDSRIPPEQVRNGYSIIDEQGRVLRMVPAAPSLEQAQAQAEQERIEQQQAIKDKALLRLYRSLEDVDQALHTVLMRVDVEARMLLNQISVKKVQRDTLQSEAATIERQGKPVPDRIMQRIAQLESDMLQLQQQLAQLEQEKQNIRQQFRHDRQRIEAILQKQQMQ